MRFHCFASLCHCSLHYFFSRYPSLIFFSWVLIGPELFFKKVLVSSWWMYSIREVEQEKIAASGVCSRSMVSCRACCCYLDRKHVERESSCIALHRLLFTCFVRLEASAALRTYRNHRSGAITHSVPWPPRAQIAGNVIQIIGCGAELIYIYRALLMWTQRYIRHEIGETRLLSLFLNYISLLS